MVTEPLIISVETVSNFYADLVVEEHEQDLQRNLNSHYAQTDAQVVFMIRVNWGHAMSNGIKMQIG